MTKEIRITPSILNADFSRLNEEIDTIAKVSDLLHLDVMGARDAPAHAEVSVTRQRTDRTNAVGGLRTE